MHKSRVFTIGIVLITAAAVSAVVPAEAADETNQATQTERQLIAVLQSDAPPQDKAITCKRLAIHGTKNAVPALGVLLSDRELSSWARIALEAIPDPEAGDALREAMDTVEGRLLVGVINSIATRRDSRAVDGLVRYLADAEAQVASAAAVALGRIGDAAARSALEESLAKTNDAVRSAVAEGCILCAEQLLEDGHLDQAAGLYEKVRQADVPQQRVLEATRGAILARRDDGIPLLVEQLQSQERELFGIGLRTARELAGNNVTQALVSEMKNATAERQALLVIALSERNDDTVLPVILETAGSGPLNVRAVAIEVLERVGDVSCVPELLHIAIENDGQLSETAKRTLAGLPGSDVNEDIATRLRQAEGKTRQALIEIVGLRRIDATAELIEAVEDSHAPIRLAALAALGSTVGPGDLHVLITRAASATESEDTQAARKALADACVRMPDRDACAQQLVDATTRAPASVRCAFLDIIGAVGGTTALESVARAAEDSHPELQDTASRLLGQWMTGDAAPVLLNLAKTAADERYRIRAMRGYIRIARQFTFPLQDRVQMCREALDTATRDTERELVLAVLERYPSLETLELAVDAASIPSLKEKATETSRNIAKKIRGRSGDVKKLLARVPGED